jgi:RNA polymerase sigma factor (sigma-70 family)
MSFSGGRSSLPGERGAFAEYRRLVSVLASRAVRLGSRDPEAAAQETLRRSLENPKSMEAVEYYLGGELPTHERVPAWPLDQLLAWLHGVLQYVVREEQGRSGFRREVPVIAGSEPADGSTGVLDAIVERETRAVVSDCFATLDDNYRKVLELRMDGLKYGQIASRLGVSENTVATWVSRGIRELGRHIRKRIGGCRE